MHNRGRQGSKSSTNSNIDHINRNHATTPAARTVQQVHVFQEGGVVVENDEVVVVVFDRVLEVLSASLPMHLIDGVDRTE